MKRLSFVAGIALSAVATASVLSGCSAGLIDDPRLSAIPHTGPAPLAVELRMHQADTFETFEWIPGDGTGLIANDSDTLFHTYNEPGTYYACCFVYDEDTVGFGDGCYAKITVTEPGFAATIDTQSGMTERCYNPEGFEIGFTRSVSGGEPPYSYHWEFGDGQRSDSNENPVYHQYVPNAPGESYTAKLTVTDSTTAVVYANEITIDVIDCGIGL